MRTFQKVDLERIQETFHTIHHQFIFHNDIPNSLIEALTLKLPQIQPNSWQERFDWGGIIVNGEEAHDLSQTLPIPCKIDYYEPRFDFKNPQSIFPHFSKDWIIFEDQHLIICYKPNRLPSLPALEQKRYNLRTYLENYTGNKIHMPSRLDMSTSGMIVASKSTLMHDLLQTVFEKREIKKEYLFHTKNQINWITCNLKTKITKSKIHPVLRTVSLNLGKIAETHFVKVISDHQGSLVRAKLLTGRTHQIRVHASFLNTPITGDNFYGGAVSESMRLVSFYLKLHHPVTKELLEFSLPEKLYPNWI